MTVPQSLDRELSRFAPTALVELFELDATDLGGEIFYFHAGLVSGASVTKEQVQFGGHVYQAFPVEATGFELTSTGSQPRPSFRFSNVYGWGTALSLRYGDLVGAKVTRRRTFARYLDRRNGGANPEADSNAQLPPDVFYIQRKTLETPEVVEYELGGIQDVEGFRLPMRSVVAATCSFQYRGAECAFAAGHCCAGRNNEGLFSEAGDLRPFPFKGAFSLAAAYQAADCVSTTFDYNAQAGLSFYSIFRARQASPGNRPLTEATTWFRIQRWRGNWPNLIAPALMIEPGDVVGLPSPYNIRVFIRLGSALLPSAWSSAAPPSVGWTLDICAKSIADCRKHFDPTGVGYALPFGGFPGTSQMPI